MAAIAFGHMRLLSRIIFGDYFYYERTFSGDMNDSTKRLFKLFTIKGIKGTIKQEQIELTWNDRSKKFQFRGTLTENNEITKLTGEFVLGTFNTIRYLVWFSFWMIGYILWELGKIEFNKEGDWKVFLAFTILGLIMFIVFLIRTNKKAKEITDAIDDL